jgi:predicted dithiol-disulfide oxidoreductase (DUF899 family)
MTAHPTATHDEWLAARQDLLEREKEHTRLGDDLARRRRELPWVRVDREYRFDTDAGSKTLAELFDGRSQLLVYHFMFGPSYEAGDPVNSSIVDAVNGVLPHVQARDATMLLVSHASLATLQVYRERMGWSISWVSDADSGFNADYGFSARNDQASLVPPLDTNELPPIVEQNAKAAGTDPAGYLSEAPGFSVFALENSVVYHTYATTWRGLEFLMSYYAILDRAPKGRDEGEGWQLWLRRHDEYDRRNTRSI